MEELAYKVRIALLWLLHIVAFFAYRTMALSDGATEVSMLENPDLATYLLAMMAFVVLSLILRRATNRSFNIIAGAVIAGTQVIMLVDGMIGYPTAAFNAMTGSTLIIMALVIWFAARWPRPQA